jgi:hypothetical protein
MAHEIPKDQSHEQASLDAIEETLNELVEGKFLERRGTGTTNDPYQYRETDRARAARRKLKGLDK